MYLVELLLVGPPDDALVLHRVGQGESLKDARSVGYDAVLAGLEAVLALLVAVHLGGLPRRDLFHTDLLPLLLGEPGVPAVVFKLGADDGIRHVEGVEKRPVQRISCRDQGIPDQEIRGSVEKRYVILVAERIREPEGIRDGDGVTGGQPGKRVGDSEGIPGFGKDQAVGAGKERVRHRGRVQAEVLLGPAALVSVGRIYDGVRTLRHHRNGDAGQAHIGFHARVGDHGVECGQRRHGDRKPYSGDKILHII